MIIPHQFRTKKFRKTFHLIPCILLLSLAVCSCHHDAKETERKKSLVQDKLLQEPGEPINERQAPASAFHETLEFKHIKFVVSTKEVEAKRQLSVQPSGLEMRNDEFITEFDGTVTHAEIGDLNADGFPEVLVFTTSAGNGHHGQVIAYSVNNGKSASPVYFPDTAKKEGIRKGYRGHDEFTIEGNKLVQRFPVYQEGDSDANPTGGRRQIQYKLVDGEASRQFVVEKILEL